MTNNFDINELFEEIKTNEFAPDVASAKKAGNDILSFGMVNTGGSGKKVSLSRGLCKRLNLDNIAFFSVLPERGIVVIGKDLPGNKTYQCNFSADSARKTCYNASLVNAITFAFKIDFSEHVSKTFYKIDIQENDGTAVAIVKMV